MDRPSKVAVPRPISSRMTSEPVGRLVEDRRGLHHLDHEGGSPARQVVSGTDTAEQAVDDPDMGSIRGHERAGLRQYRDQRILPQEGRFTRHVRTGDQPQPVGLRQGRSHWRLNPPSRAAASAASTTG